VADRDRDEDPLWFVGARRHRLAGPGLLVAPGDPAALAAAIAELRTDPAQRERLGAAAAADVRERFAPARLLARTQALYDDLLEEPFRS